MLIEFHCMTQGGAVLFLEGGGVVSMKFTVNFGL